MFNEWWPNEIGEEIVVSLIDWESLGMDDIEPGMDFDAFRTRKDCDQSSFVQKATLVYVFSN
jgi:hypothetical protein